MNLSKNVKKYEINILFTVYVSFWFDHAFWKWSIQITLDGSEGIIFL